MSDSEVPMFVITLADGIDASSVVGDLEAQGLQVKRVLAALGQIIGQGSEQVAEHVRGLDAVHSVDVQRTYKALDD